jgi:hypothetical protein
MAVELAGGLPRYTRAPAHEKNQLRFFPAHQLCYINLQRHHCFARGIELCSGILDRMTAFRRALEAYLQAAARMAEHNNVIVLAVNALCEKQLISNS